MTKIVYNYKLTEDSEECINGVVIEKDTETAMAKVEEKTKNAACVCYDILEGYTGE